jgi:branched-chain amino acid transport system permease protein
MRGPVWYLILLVALVAPLFTSDYYQHVILLIFFWAYLGTSWNILGGYAGQLSLGHAVFFGVGAYTSSLLFVNLGLSPWIGMLVGGLVAALVGLFIGFASFHYGLKGPYFALVTIAFGEVMRHIFNNWQPVGAAMGILIPLEGNAPGIFQFSAKYPYYYIALAMMLIGLEITRAVERSKFGYQMVALRENEDTAESLGVNTKGVKLTAIALSSFLTGMGGSFYAQYFLYIDPETVFLLSVSVDIALRPIIGGLGTIAGPVIGSFILTPLSEITRLVFGGRYAGVALMSYGLILMAVVLLAPGGAVGWFRDLRRRATKRTVGKEEA